MHAYVQDYADAWEKKRKMLKRKDEQLIPSSCMTCPRFMRVLEHDNKRPFCGISKEARLYLARLGDSFFLRPSSF